MKKKKITQVFERAVKSCIKEFKYYNELSIHNINYFSFL